MRRGEALRSALLAGGVALLAWTPGAGAQEARGLDGVDSLIADGRIGTARRILQEWWDEALAGADRRDRQHALWLRGKLTVDPDQALRDFQRLVVEYPGGPYTADALLRVAQAADARGRLVEAARRYDQLVREYPSSPHGLEARRWLDAHGPAVSRAQRSAPEAAPGPSERSEAAPDTMEEPEPAGPVAVQLGAFSTVERARSLAELARAEGFEVRLVRVGGSELVRVRAGRFPDRSAARDLLDRVRGTGLQADIVTDAREESPIR